MVRRGVPGYTRRRRVRRSRKQKGGLVLPRRQKGGILPLFLIPAAIAAAKAAALGAVSGAAGYGAKKAIDAARRR